MLAVFTGWSVQSLCLGGPVAPGITVIGEGDAIKTVTNAFDAADIPYKVERHGYTGPGSMGPAPLTITISRSAE